jgi:hypothetical protein
MTLVNHVTQRRNDVKRDKLFILFWSLPLNTHHPQAIYTTVPTLFSKRSLSLLLCAFALTTLPHSKAIAFLTIDSCAMISPHPEQEVSMEQEKQTKGSRYIEQLMQQLPPESERYQVLATAKQFKSSWVELGEWLARISNSKQFSEWGFTSFEDYCTREIRIRRQTAEKLLLAFRFLERKEPGLLERKAGRPLPDYRSVDLLRQADEEKHFSMAEYGELRQSVIEEERSHPSVAKQFRDISHTHQPEQRTARQYRNALIAAKRLSTSLQEISDLPQDLSQAVEQLIGFLVEAGDAGRETQDEEDT